MRKIAYLVLGFVVGLMLTGCGTSNQAGKDDGKEEPKKVQSSVPENHSGWETIEVVDNRPIIAKLEQTAKELPARDKALERNKHVLESDEELGKAINAEELTIQSVELNTATNLLQKIYGGYKGMDDAGVVFLSSKSSGDAVNGVWIGIKKADDRLTKFVKEMQKKVDEGEVKAKYIYIFYTPFTTTENNQLMTNVHSEASRIGRQDYNPDKLTLGTSVDVVTGNIQIEHNFLTDEQKKTLEKKFSDRTIEFTQQGRMAPKKGESDVLYPEKTFSEKPVSKGEYITEVTEENVLVGTTYYEFPKASEKLKVGQQVKVEDTGSILTSFPGQGRAVYIEVLPEYKPAEADLSETKVIQQTITQQSKQKGSGILIIKNVAYDKKKDEWVVTFQVGLEEEEKEIKLKD
jgi:hypothetical protein